MGGNSSQPASATKTSQPASTPPLWEEVSPDLSHLPLRYCKNDSNSLFSQPWRTIPKSNQENLDFVKSYRPQNKEVSHLRILLHGPVGAGKSGFINSVDSVFQGRITNRALTDATSGSSFTKKYTTYKFHKDQDSFYSFIFNDTMGLQLNNGVHVEDIKLALNGHVTEGHKFSLEHQLKEKDEGYNSSPTLDDRVHVLVSVVPAGSVSSLSDEVLKKMREVRMTASEMGIPQLGILTRVDEACPKVKTDLKNIYKSKYLKQQNYNSEINTNDDINVLILGALRQMITSGEDFLNSL
ncbi:interferon-induced protein 44-like isoform X2 [Dicentrarchus labrax]|uniref:interferon-induced protein 44-like isoform X2 n=1 Tax=Dicentrarchus labrax TaxID=13489 RepID=UPI0021F57EE6|nr:interferon-induced protein 44-like isoform X2 [Dicentrarchus labrax]